MVITSPRGNQLCMKHEDQEDDPCEQDIRGALALNQNSTVAKSGGSKLHDGETLLPIEA
jgi:hypothetical protein